jgi:hypothetical protein
VELNANDRDFVGKLKWRKDARVAEVYAATAFVVLHAADLLTSGLRLPEWVFTTVAVLLVFGIPIAVVLGWVLEVTPEGVRVTTSAPAETAEHNSSCSADARWFLMGTIGWTPGAAASSIGHVSRTASAATSSAAAPSHVHSVPSSTSQRIAPSVRSARWRSFSRSGASDTMARMKAAGA